MKDCLVLLSLVAVVLAGCCTNPNNCPPGAVGLANARVAPPATNSYSLANQPYYQSNVTPAGTVLGSSPSGVAAPLPPGVSPPAGTLSAPTNQWQPAGQSPPGTSGFYGPPYQPQAGAAQYNAAASGMTPYGYQTTTSTGVADATRMPAIDATGVRAPVGLAQATNLPNVVSAPILVPGSLEYSSNMQIVGAQPTAAGYPPNYSAGANYVLAQASTKHMENDPNYRYGWRSANSASGVR